MAITPNETDSPLIIDANGVLPFPVASQGLQLIPRRRSQNTQLRGSMQLEQFPQGDPFEGPEALAVLVVKKLLSFLRAKALDHT
jgi:hypothetical protein